MTRRPYAESAFNGHPAPVTAEPLPQEPVPGVSLVQTEDGRIMLVTSIETLTVVKGVVLNDADWTEMEVKGEFTVVGTVGDHMKRERSRRATPQPRPFPENGVLLCDQKAVSDGLVLVGKTTVRDQWGVEYLVSSTRWVIPEDYEHIGGVFTVSGIVVGLPEDDRFSSECRSRVISTEWEVKPPIEIAGQWDGDQVDNLILARKGWGPGGPLG